jgi:TetR/AcrR family transcriptional repressor of mexJK operon
MKNWPADHPKAKLLGRKREAILAAARRQFLANGFDGTSMDAIAAEAGVSIMTLYRHAKSKDDLFAAVISIACGPDEYEAQAAMATMSLEDILMATALAFQQKLASDETAALLRAVVAEHGRFPDLSTVAYRGVVGHLEEFVDRLLAARPEARAIDKKTRQQLGSRFADSLFGADTLRVLLGLEGKSPAEQKRRAMRATSELLGSLSRASTTSGTRTSP